MPRAIDSRLSSGTQSSSSSADPTRDVERASARAVGAGCLSNPLSNSASCSLAEALGLIDGALLSKFKSGAGVGCSKRGSSEAGEPLRARVISDTAGTGKPESTLLLHFGQRIIKGRAGIFASSTCNRVEQFWQTIIMASFRKWVEFSNGS